MNRVFEFQKKKKKRKKSRPDTYKGIFENIRPATIPRSIITRRLEELELERGETKLATITLARGALPPSVYAKRFHVGKQRRNLRASISFEEKKRRGEYIRARISSPSNHREREKQSQRERER